MALPSPSKVAGAYFATYENYYAVVDPESHGKIGAMEAAKFLKKSNLSDIILSKIWDLSDPESRGYLDQSGMFVALKLCALAQQGHNLAMANIQMDVPPPNMGEIREVPRLRSGELISVKPENKTCWTINPLERAKYKQLFQSLEPINGYIPGNKVKGVLMDSKLPLEILGKIWDLADIDKDGKLNEHEFIVAMHLVYKALEKNTVPSILPVELRDTTIPPPPTTTNIDSQFQTLSNTNVSIDSSNVPQRPSNEPVKKWVVSEDDRKVAEKLFIQADADCDGFVSGGEIKDIFFQSGLAQAELAHIWNLCDVFQHGKLNNEQFALAMWLIKQKLNKHEIPATLSSDMIPPSLRPANTEQEVENNNVCNFLSSNPEFEIIGQEINSIIREKQLLEQDLSQKDADIKIKTGEIKSLQSELDTLAATLRQLDNQKGEAQKRLNDLKLQIEKLRQQAVDQESTLRVQEDEINSKRQELEVLKLAEQNLDSQQSDYKNQLAGLSNKLLDTQLKFSQTKAKITQLEEKQRQIIDTITQYDSAFSMGDPSVVPESALYLQISLDEYICDPNGAVKIENDSRNNNFKESQAFNDDNDKFDTTQAGDSFDAAFALAKEPVHDPFGEDPFAALHAPVRSGSPSPALPPKKTKQAPPRPAPPRPNPAMSSSVGGSVTVSFSTNMDSNVSSNTGNSNAFDFADFDNFQSKVQ